MATEMIAIQCPICSAYMDPFDDDVYRCPRCTARLNVASVATSKWGMDRKFKHDQEHGLIEDRYYKNYRRKQLFPEKYK